MKVNLTFKMYLAYVNLTITQMAQVLECSAGYLQLVISGHKRPSAKLNRAIVRATDGWVNLLEPESSAEIRIESKKVA